MNKKIFTLLASSLMLFIAAIGMNAQPYFGDPVVNLPSGQGKGAYHIKVTHFGNDVDDTNPLFRDMVVALDSTGSLKLVDRTYFDAAGKYKELREALWCVDVKDKEILGKWPTYNFINKEYNTLLAVDSGRWRGNDYYYSQYPTWWGNAGGAEPTTPNYPHIWSQLTGTALNARNLRPYLDGQFANWRFSETYNTTPLQSGQPLLIEIPGEPDFFLTFATRLNYSDGVGAFEPTIELVKVNIRDLDPVTPAGDEVHFYKYSLLRFELVQAAPRVLNANDFNSKFGTQALTNNSTTALKFNKDVEGDGVTNVLSQALRATNVAGTSGKGQYMTLSTGSGANLRYVYVADGDTAENYYSDKGLYYPVIKMTNNVAVPARGRGDFRMVYYPSEDSLVINVRSFDHIDYGLNWDGNLANGEPAYGPGGSGGGGYYDLDYPLGPVDPVNSFFNLDILWYLNVRMQDLVTAEGKRVLTVADYPVNTYISFGINNCEISDNRVTVPRNLYVIRDQLGRYLVMPLETGDFTPQWIEPRNNEDPMKTPSYQWLVYPMNENATNSSVVMINREFDWVQIDFASIYRTATLFYGTCNVLVPGTVDYDNIFGAKGGALISYSDNVTSVPNLKAGQAAKWNIPEGWHGSFLKVQDDAAAAAKVTADIPLTQEEMQKLYRTSPYLGYKYIAEDTLNYFTYSFNHLHNYAKNRYLGPNTKQLGDTILYGIEGQNHFELILPANRREENGTEKYGIGWKFDLKDHASTADIAPLERYYYEFKENNYWDFTFNDNFVVLGDNRRYGFTDKDNATQSGMQKAAFYIRFTYQPQGAPEYYTLLHRIPIGNWPYYQKEMNLFISQELKTYDVSHDSRNTSVSTLRTDTLGVLALAIDDNTAYARAYSKVLRDMVSTFAISNAVEPLYRRFNEGVYIPSGIDAGVDDGGVRANDDPRLVKIYRAWNEEKVDYLYEDANSVNAREFYKWTEPSKGINYLSLENIYDHNAWMDQGVGHYPHNFSFYLDTAYVNRGTGHIKPQYMLVVGPEKINEHGCFLCGDPIALREGIYGRYLINATDSAYNRYTSGANNGAQNWGSPRPNGDDYIWEINWERLVFVPALHIGDSLYILRNGQDYKSLSNYSNPKIIREDEFGVEYLHLPSLVEHASKSTVLIDIHPLDNNLHKDYVFSMRFYERGDYEHFLIESETWNRHAQGTNAGRMIAPMNGGWVKWHNNEMVITRGSYSDAIRDGEKWNTEPTTDDPVANDEIAASAVKVIAGEGNVTILNAAGKRVTISNVLGQTVAGAVLTSDNAAIAAPKGILVVAVEGENAVKAVVK